MPLETRVVVQALDVPATQVYAYVRQMENLPQWASGLASGIRQDADGRWVADSPMGRVSVLMAPRNDFGVLDHDVTLPDGSTVHNALRVVPAGDDGSVLSFVLVRLAGVSQADFDQDVAHIEHDLKALKGLLENDRR